MELIFILIALFLIIYLAAAYYFLKSIKKDARAVEKTIGVLYFFSLQIFLVGFSTHNVPYYKAIDIVGGFECYCPFSQEHLLSFFFYILLFNISIFLIWKTNGKLPPLIHVLTLIFTFIGIILNVLIILQISQHDTKSLDNYYTDEGMTFFILFPSLGLFVGIYLLCETIILEIKKSSNREFNNKYLSAVNNYISEKNSIHFWVLILFLPILFFCTLLLILLGQDINSMVKVFTDTTTWRFSQQIHPPILDHQGHYICTVAACGSPEIVKPIRLGKRNGNTIIVNRQLLIANAFEEILKDVSTDLHHLIRSIYDKYGYNISKHINSTHKSNITYKLMKPLEWIFLMFLYLFCLNPEEKINKQYKL